MGRIEAVKRGNRIFYRVAGNRTDFYDLDNLVYNHPELKKDVEENRIALERVLMQQREMKHAYEMG